jgi:hypothetical protein
MSKPKANEDQLEPESARARASDEPIKDEDTEGHMFQPDYGTSRHLANSRNAEIERQAKDRQRQKEAEARNQRR